MTISFSGYFSKIHNEKTTHIQYTHILEGGLDRAQQNSLSHAKCN